MTAHEAPAPVSSATSSTGAAAKPGRTPHGTPSTPHQESVALCERLRNIRVGLRQDLEVSRHIFRGAPCYIIRDPITFQSQRFDPPEYEMLVRIRSDRSLGETFADLAAADRLDGTDEERFAEFVLGLHRLGFLRLPVSDDKSLYQRFELRARAERRRKWLSALFLRIPLWNPDRFLGRTVAYVRPLFTRTAFTIWCLWVGAAALVAWRSWGELSNPLQDVLVSLNVPLLVGTLLILKVFHEFGHAYACKHFGGHVPDMGVYLILFTPCAYVDATASWGFGRKRDRLIVCLAGMYVEAAIAAAAMFVWHLADGALVRSIAHHVIFLASAVTVLFNINPLMRYDGYYILSDLVEVPNLREKSRNFVSGLAKRLLLGIRTTSGGAGRRLRLILGGYGIASTLYRVSLLVAIGAILASKFSIAGLLVGILMLGTTVAGAGLRFTNYLWYSGETTACRGRAIVLSIVTLILLPVGVMWLPMPSGVVASAVLGAEMEAIVRVDTAGVLEALPVPLGVSVRRGDPLVRLSNDLVDEGVVLAEANLAAHRLRTDALRERDPAQFQQAAAQRPAIEHALHEAEARKQELSMPAPMDGTLVQRVRETELGSFLTTGVPIATIVAGSWEVRAVLTAEQMNSARPEPGATVEFRPAGDPNLVLRGTVSRVTPAGSRKVSLPPLTHVGGGEIAVEPTSGTATEPYFEVAITLPSDAAALGADTPALRFGMTGAVRFDGAPEPVGVTLARRVLRFWNKLLQG